MTKERPNWVGVCDIHLKTQESDDIEFVLYRAPRCCSKYAVTDRTSWEARVERDRFMAELKAKKQGPFTKGSEV